MKPWVATVALLLMASAHAESYFVLPADPQAGETIAITFAVPPPPGALCLFQPQLGAQLSGSDIEVVAAAPARPAGAAGWCRGGASITVPSPGRYSIHVSQLLSQASPFTLTNGASLQLDVAASTASQPAWRGLDGNWFDPAEPGWGVNFVQGDSGALFAVLLTYKDAHFIDGTRWPASSQTADWLVMPSGRWITPTMFRGALYAATNAPWIVGANGGAATSAIGFAALQFADATHVRLSAQYLEPTGGVLRREATLQRFSF